jgi:(p)ppGpp synthase/HD superfamily hydrolase
VPHLISVAALVLEDGGSEDEAIAGLLHDAIEDQGRGNPYALRQEIAARLGNQVLDIVEAHRLRHRRTGAAAQGSLHLPTKGRVN